MVDKNNNSIILKFKAIREQLDWQGNVVERVENYTYKWDNYAPQIFLKSVINNGDLSCVPSLNPSSSSPIDFMHKIDKDFDRFEDYNYILKRFRRIESEPFNGMKFIVYDRATDTKMKWVMEK